MRIRLFGLLTVALLGLLVACGGPPATTPPPTQDAQDAAPTAAGAPAEPAQPEPAQPEPATAAPEPTAAPTAIPPTAPVAAVDPAQDCIVDVTATGETFTGTGALAVQVRNDTDQPIVCVIPAGYVFEPPPDVDEQRLMALQETAVELQPGEEATLDPYVACIDADQSAPSAGVPFTPAGSTEDESLQALAACLDQQALPEAASAENPFAASALQFAVWNVSDGMPVDLESIMSGELGEDGALADVMPAEEMEGLTEMFAQFFGGGEEWLALCGIEPREGDTD